MKQLTQNLKTGKMTLLEEPFPALGKGQVQVRNHYSVISAGTESRSVKDARAGYLGKAKSRPEELKKVVETIKTNGVGPTYRAVMNRLDAPSPLGYSCAGEVIAVGEQVREFRVGDRVACGGNGAVHSEIADDKINTVFIATRARFYTPSMSSKHCKQAGKHVFVEELNTPNLKAIWQARRQKMLADKIDVTAFMVWFIENYPESAKIMRRDPSYQLRFKEPTAHAPVYS